MPFRLGFHRQVHEMFHEDLETHIVREDNFSLAIRAVVRDRWVEFRHEKPRLTLVLVAHDVSRHWEPRIHNQLGIRLGRLQKFLEVFVLWVLMEFLITPRTDRIAMEHDHVEKRIQQQDRVGRTLAASKSAGTGGPLNEYDNSDGWIITSELVALSRNKQWR